MKKLYPLLCSILILTAVFSCKNEPIFYAIEKEIALEKPVVLGNVLSMTQADDKLYAAAGKLYVKNSKDIRSWNEAAKPGFVIQVASDDTHLYVRDKEANLYSSPHGTSLSWTKIDTAKMLFDNNVLNASDNNALNASGKKAFAVKDNGVYELTDGRISSTVSYGGASGSSVAAEYINDASETFFSASPMFTSNRTNTLYRIVSGNIEYITDITDITDNTKWKSLSIPVMEPKSLEFYKRGGSSYLLIGTKTGVITAILNSPTSAALTTIPGDNADSCFGKSEVPFIFTFSDNIYVFSLKPDTTKDTKFWAYYPSRDNWNLE